MRNKNNRTIFFITTLIALTSCNISNDSNSSSQPQAKKIMGENISNDDIIINMATANFDDNILEKNLVEEFNKTDNGYHINVIDYTDYYDIEVNENKNIVEAFNAADMRIVHDLINDTDIDMTLNLLTNERIVSLAQKGAFVDLNEFMKNDNEINRNILNDHILDVCELDNELFYMPLGYSINTLYGYEKNVGKMEDWNTESMKSNWYKMQENSVFCSSNIGGEDTSSNVFSGLFINCIPSFIDYSTNKCNFESDEFVEILDFINEFRKERLNDKADLAFSECFLTTANISGFNTFRNCLFNFGNGEKISFVGYPSLNNGNSLVSLIGDAEICAKSSKEVQKGAWEFIKFLVSYDSQVKQFFPEVTNTDDSEDNYSEENYYDLGFPINDKVFKDEADKLMSDETEDNYIAVNGTSYNMGKLTNEEFLLLEEIINSTTQVNVRVTDLYIIVDEEVQKMFEGSQTSVQTASSIQNRASILLSE